MINDNLTYKVIGCIHEVYNSLGPGLLESVYESALMHEFHLRGINAQNQLEINVDYKGINVGKGFRIDILVEKELILELKSVETIRPVHAKQLMTYLKLTNLNRGLLVNFNEDNILDVVHRIVI